MEKHSETLASIFCKERISHVANRDSSRQVLEFVRQARAERQAALNGLQIYQAGDGRQAVSNGQQHQHLPRSFSPWVLTVMLDWATFGCLLDKYFRNQKDGLTPHTTMAGLCCCHGATQDKETFCDQWR